MFFTKLKQEDKNKIYFERLRTIFLSLFPEQKFIIDCDNNITNLLLQMEEDELINLPSKKGTHWECMPNYFRPKWIQVISELKNKVINDVVWHPKLKWATDIKHPAQLEIAIKINNYLKNNSSKMNIPLNERSLMIFDDEKKLASLTQGESLFGGKLSIKDLNCYQVTHPFCYSSPVSCKTNRILILENAATYHSFCRWNDLNQQYQAIVLGSGGMFENSHWSLETTFSILPDVGFEYFGDLDPSGLRIPANINKERLKNKLTQIIPQQWLYEQMIAAKKHFISKDKETECTQEDILWLPCNLRNETKELIKNNQRIPQEILNLEWLFGFTELAIINVDTNI